MYFVLHTADGFCMNILVQAYVSNSIAVFILSVFNLSFYCAAVLCFGSNVMHYREPQQKCKFNLIL